jgi:type I restriction-modification system DNA methylase subunit
MLRPQRCLGECERLPGNLERFSIFALIVELNGLAVEGVDVYRAVCPCREYAKLGQDRDGENKAKAELQAVPGLVKLVDREEIEAADWSLTPGRYVGVAPPEEDQDFDFEQALRDIHTELADLNKETAELAAKIQKNFEELGA